MITARHSHTATLLPDGKVLIVGGYGANGLPLASAELYDPASGAFSSTGSLNTARVGHAASLLSGPGQPTRVIVYGGNLGSKVFNTAEIWTESTGAFTQAGSMAMAATSVPPPVEFQDLGIALAGGYDENFRITANEQLLDPQSGAFSGGKTMNAARVAHTLTRLASGDLLAIGGITVGGNGRSVTSASAEKRTAGEWTLTSDSCPNTACLLTGRAYHTASILPDGSVFVAGGVDQNGLYLSGTEGFDPSSNTFSAGPLAAPRAYATAVAFATSTTTLTASPNPAPVGDNIALVATVTALMSGTPEGTVVFRDGSTPLASVALSNGQALFNTSTLTVGSHTLTAAYFGTGYPGASTSPPVTVVVQKQQTTAALVSSPNPSTLRQTVTLRTTISPANASGNVMFQDGSVALGTVPVANGMAQLLVDNLAIGSHSITAVYSGDTEHAGCTSPALIQVVTSIGTSTSLRVTPPEPVFGQSLELSATVTSALGTPTGNVTFQDTNTVLGTAPLVNGTAIFHTIPSAAGLHTFEAAYSGSSVYAASSVSLTVFVRHAATSVGLTSSLNPAPQGQTVMFTATVSVPIGTPTGSVTFRDGTTHLATVILAHSVAAFSTSTLPLGTHLITGVYSGDSNFAGSTSPVLSQTISPAGKVTPTVTLTVNGSNSATIQPGDIATFSVRIHAVAGYPWPTGSITISDSTNADHRYGAGNLTKDPNSNDGIASVPIAWMTPGSYTLLATYGGDNEGKYYNGAQSNTVALKVSNPSR